MVLTNQIAGFFDHQYLWKESMMTSNFSQIIINKEMINQRLILLTGYSSVCTVTPKIIETFCRRILVVYGMKWH